MENLDGKELVIDREIAKNVLDEFQSVYLKVEKNCLKDAEEYEEIKSKINTSRDIDGIFENARKLESIKDNLIFNFALKDRVHCFVNKNKQRMSFLDNIIKNEKLPSIDVNSRLIATKLDDKKLVLSKNSLQLNSKISSEAYYYFDRRLFKTKSGELDLSFKPNLDALFSEDDRNFEIILNNFPSSISKFPDEVMADVQTKNRILKYVTMTAYKLFNNNKSGYEVNEFFGFPLVVSRFHKVDFNLFIHEMENLFNVKAKKYLLDNFPANRKMIEEKLTVNLESEYLPENYGYSSKLEQALIDLVERDIEELIGDDIYGDD